MHPSEAEVISKAFGEVRIAAEIHQGALQEIIGALDPGWEGNQKSRFLEALRITTGRIRNILLPQLRFFEKKYREYMVDPVIEDAGKT